MFLLGKEKTTKLPKPLKIQQKYCFIGEIIGKKVAKCVRVFYDKIVFNKKSKRINK